MRVQGRVNYLKGHTAQIIKGIPSTLTFGILACFLSQLCDRVVKVSRVPLLITEIMENSSSLGFYNVHSRETY